MTLLDDFRAAIDLDGFAVVARALSHGQVDEALAATREGKSSGVFEDPASKKARGGRRDLLARSPYIARLAGSTEVRSLVEPVLGAGAFAVRCLWFDKHAGANWKVPWHQDLTIAVRERREVEGFSAWSVKAGIQHVQPPCEILERMLSIRLHLDSCDEENGPLRVIRGSHRHGRLRGEDITRWSQRGLSEVCLVPAGGAVAFRPLLLHASSAAIRPEHRRVIHLEFAAEPLPGGLEWHEQIGCQ